MKLASNLLRGDYIIYFVHHLENDLPLKFGIFTNPKRPKISQDRIFKLIQLTGVTYSAKDPDIAIVVGGDGTFGYYGRILSIPMLFVGVNDPELLGSKARLAEIFFNNLDKVLRDINLGKYIVEEKKDVFC